jgi:hypothetical protein
MKFGILVMGLASTYFVIAVALIALKRFLPQRSGTVTSTRLGIVGDKRFSYGVFFVNVRFPEGDEMRVPFAFWGSDRLRITASQRYQRLQRAFPDGATARLAYLPKGEWLFGHIPLSPVVRVETIVYVTMAMLSALLLWRLLVR